MTFRKPLKLLRSVPFFQYLGYKDLVQVVNLAERIEVPRGERIGSEDTLTRALFVVIQGELEVRERGVTSVVGATEHFGSASLVDEGAAVYVAHAISDSIVMRMNVDRFMELLRHDSDLAVKVLWNFLHHVTVKLRTSPVVNTHDLDQTEHTPARGTLVFEEDMKSSGGLEADKTIDIDTDHLRNVAARDAAAKAVSIPAKAIQMDDEPVVDGDVTQIPALKGAVQARPAASSTEDLDWEGIEALLHEDVSDEDLRKTVRIDDFSQSEKTMPSLDGVPKKASGFSGISGESVAKPSAPKAQVFKKNKLVVGEESAAEDDESLADRLRKKREGIKKSIEDVS
ncbi:MAG: cyclic nucleotide-binding domain-containing protein [bacterium]